MAETYCCGTCGSYTDSPRVLCELCAPTASRSADQAAAIATMLAVIDEWTALPCPSFTCTEAERISDFVSVFAGEDKAAAFLEAHAIEDEPGDLHYQGDE